MATGGNGISSREGTGLVWGLATVYRKDVAPRRLVRGSHAAGLLAALCAAACSLALAASAQAAFPGTNGKIAFDTTRGTDVFPEVFTMNPDGSSQTNITNLPGWDALPAWSADGSKIAFETNRDGNFEIYTMNPDGTAPLNVTNNPALEEGAAWSPDGTKIAFWSNRDGNDEIYVANADGTGGATRLTNNLTSDQFPTWSPDGTKIAFQSTRNTFPKWELYVMNADGSGTPTRLTNNTADDVVPDWSPDGTKIVYISGVTGNDEIYTLNADGSGTPTQLTNSADSEGGPVWSPDGTKIAFSKSSDIFTMNADGTGDTNVTNVAGVDRFPDWQPLPPVADLAVTKSDSPDPVFGGDRLTYTVTVSNNGPSTAYGVTMVDTVDRSVRIRSARSDHGACRSVRRSSVTCQLGDLPNGDVATITILAYPTRKGTITNTASASASSPTDPDTSNNTANATTTVKP